jgi:hypothetical protein
MRLEIAQAERSMDLGRGDDGDEAVYSPDFDAAATPVPVETM